MGHRGLILCLGLLALWLTGCNNSLHKTAQAQHDVPTVAGNWGNATDFTFTTFDGKTEKLSSLAGKPLVVNFWADWCPPCVAELPEFAEVYKAKGSQFQLVGIASDDSKDAEGFVKQNGYSWTFGKSAEAYRLYQIDAIPLTLFIDRKGNLIDKSVGGMQKAEFEEKLAKII
jgi:thiol-disulfide isomerase/thioredoxin